MSIGGVLRVAARTLLVWGAAATSVLTLGFSIGRELPSRHDLVGFLGFTLVGVLLLAPLVYLPGLLWLRRERRGRLEAPVYGVLAATLLNLPVVLLLLMGSLRGSFGAGEAVMLGAIFAITAGGFGWSLGREWR